MTEKLSARQLRKQRQEQMLRTYKKNLRRNLLAAPGVYDFINVPDHLKAGCNVLRIIHNAKTFDAREVQLINIRPFDSSFEKSVFRQLPAGFIGTFASIAMGQTRT